MTSHHVQYALAFIFLSLGAWCLIYPGTVEQMVFEPSFRHDSITSHVLIGCFGAQAILAGIIIATSNFNPSTFLIFGLIGSVPFFGFNYYFYFVQQMFTPWMLLDFVGNIGILTTSLIGYRLKVREQIRQPTSQARQD